MNHTKPRPERVRPSTVFHSLLASLWTIVAVGFAQSLTAEDSPRFRGVNGSGTSSEVGIPLNWSATKNLVWKTPLPGYGASSPITLGDKIYITAYSGYGSGGDKGEKSALRSHVLCVNRSDGAIVWDKSTVGNSGEQDYSGWLPRHGYSSATPATDGVAVYAFFGSSGVVAYDLDGKFLWKADVGSGTHGWGSGASPAVFENIVIINAGVESGALVGLDRISGKEVWRTPGIAVSYSTPLLLNVEGQPEAIVHSTGRIISVNPATGEELWRYETGVGAYICPSLIAHGNVVYGICGRGGKLVAVRAGGRGDVTKTHEVWAAKGCPSNVPSPVYHDGHIYWVSDTGIGFSIDAETGGNLKQKRLDPSGNVDVYASVLSVEDKLVVVSRERGTFVLTRSPKLERLALNVIEGDSTIFNASPVASRGQLLLRSERFLYCVGGSAAAGGD